MGLCYAYGEGVEKDSAEAVKWYRKAADQNYAKAQHFLGDCYKDGQGVEKDDVEAVKWYRKAAEQDFAAAQLQLGYGYEYGQGAEKNDAEAVKWYRKAAEQGSATAQFNLGACYLSGRGVEKDSVEAVRWYRKAAEQNDATAQCFLGISYHHGQGVEKDDVEAVKWFRKAAEQNEARAQTSLGLMYLQGVGVPKDLVEAYKWANLAAAIGTETAKEIRALLDDLMTPSQIAEGQKLSREFRPLKRGGMSLHENLDDDSPRSDEIPMASGSGFFITTDGWLVTNAHVVEGGSSVRVRTGSGLVFAKVIRRDEANDLALLKVVGSFDALPVATSRSMKLGQTVATVGFPDTGLQGFSPKLAKGEIASLAGARDDPRHFQISVPVQPGNSGGPLVDTKGNVVGVVVAKLSARAALAATGALPENVNYAVKSSFLLSFLESAPEMSANLKEVNTREHSFEDTVATVQKATALVLVYR
jgi:TPR repeat protein